MSGKPGSFRTGPLQATVAASAGFAGCAGAAWLFSDAEAIAWVVAVALRSIFGDDIATPACALAGVCNVGGLTSSDFAAATTDAAKLDGFTCASGRLNGAGGGDGLNCPAGAELAGSPGWVTSAGFSGFEGTTSATGDLGGNFGPVRRTSSRFSVSCGAEVGIAGLVAVTSIWNGFWTSPI